MAASKTYLVPLDLSRPSAKAFAQAVKLARENKAKLLLFHGIAEPGARVPFQLRDHYYSSLEREARVYFKKLVARHRLSPKNYRVVMRRGNSAAQLICEQARKSRVSMIIMGSHGHTGLSRVIMGSVAEETLRCAHCPVLIVK